MDLMEKKTKTSSSPLKYLNVLSWVLVLGCWAYVCFQYAHLPVLIPTHFNGVGQADGFSSRQMIFILPTLITLLNLGLMLLNRYPHQFNYPVEITKENRSQQYENSQMLLVTIQLAITLVFALILFYSIRAALLQQEFIPVWLLPLSLFLIFAPIFLFLWRAYKIS